LRVLDWKKGREPVYFTTSTLTVTGEGIAAQALAGRGGCDGGGRS